MAKGTINVIFPPFLQSRAYAVSLIGLLSSLFGIFQLVARLPSGVLYSPRYAKLTLSVGLLMLGLTALGFTAFESLAALTVMIVLNGFAFGSITTVALALAIDAKPPDYASGAMMGWYTSAIAAGYSVGQPVGGFLADRYGFAAGYAGTAVLSLIAILIILSLSGLGSTAPQSAADKETQRVGRQFRLRRSDLGQIPAGVLLATAIVFFLNLMFRSLHTFFPLYALAAGITLSQIGLLRSILSLMATLVRPLSGKLFEVVHHRRVTHAAMVAAAAAVMIATALTPWMLWLMVLFAFMGLSRGLLRVTSATFLAESNEQIGGGRIGVWSGLYNGGLDFGALVGPAVGGYLASLMGIEAMLRVLPIVALATYTIISLLAWRRAEQLAAPAAS